MAAWARAARACCRSGSRLLAAESPGTLAAKSQTTRAVLPSRGQGAARGFAAGGLHDTVVYGGLPLHKPAKWHVYVGQGMSGLMWFWILYRFYHDHEAFLYGHAVHFEHDDDHEEHEEHH